MSQAGDQIRTSCGTFKIAEHLRENSTAVQTLRVARVQENAQRGDRTSQSFILKRLICKNAEGLDSLRREARCLQKFSHPRIPRLISSQLETEDSACLLMEYLPGVSLKDWIEQENSVTPALLHRWLEQACKLLGHVHAQGLVHQDISPNNIILRGHKIHLIDFGGSQGTYAYAAPELLFDTDDDEPGGQHTPQTDLYALGMTFQHVLFGKGWTDLTERERQSLQNEVSADFTRLTALLFQLTAEAPGARPNSADQVLAKLRAIKPLRQKIKEKRRWLPGAIALSASTLVIGLRLSGLLQSAELKAYDSLMGTSAQLYPETQDEKLAVITIDKADYDFQRNHSDPAMAPEGDDSISDAALNKLLSRFLDGPTVPPSVVGLDLRRDKTVSPEYPYLKQLFQQKSQDQPLRLVCYVAENNETSEPFGPPTDAPPDTEIVTFSDLLVAHDTVEAGTVRRATLAFSPDEASVCNAYNSLALAAVTRYFTNKGATTDWQERNEVYNFEIALDSTSENAQSNRTNASPSASTTTLPFLPDRLHVGGYRLPSPYGAGSQVFINYRRRRKGPADVAPTLSLRDVLQGNYAPDTFADKVVLIGVDRTATSQVGDQQRVPYGGSPVPGVFIHANIISQLIAYVEDDRRLIWTLPQSTGDSALILLTALCATGTMLWIKKTKRGTVCAISYGVGGMIVIYALSLGAFVGWSLWLPLIPATLTWLLTVPSIFAIYKYEEENPYAY